jgi:hypothetical protein
MGVVTGNVPFIRFSTPTKIGESTYLINISEMLGTPGLFLGEYFHVLASIYKNGTEIISDAEVKNGTVGYNPPTILNFTDIDSNNFLNIVDYFTIECEPNSIYTFELTKGSVKYRVTWAT